MTNENKQGAFSAKSAENPRESPSSDKQGGTKIGIGYYLVVFGLGYLLGGLSMFYQVWRYLL